MHTFIRQNISPESLIHHVQAVVAIYVVLPSANCESREQTFVTYFSFRPFPPARRVHLTRTRRPRDCRAIQFVSSSHSFRTCDAAKVQGRDKYIPLPRSDEIITVLSRAPGYPVVYRPEVVRVGKT